MVLLLFQYSKVRQKTKTFNVGEFNEADVYMIPDETLDADTAIVRVIDGSTSDCIY